MTRVTKFNNAMNWHVDHYVPLYGWEDTGISALLPDWIALELLTRKYGTLDIVIQPPSANIVNNYL